MGEKWETVVCISGVFLGPVLDLNNPTWVDDIQSSGPRLHLSSELQAPASNSFLDRALRICPNFSNSVWLLWNSPAFTLSTLIAGFVLVVMSVTRSPVTSHHLCAISGLLSPKPEALLWLCHCDQAPGLQSGQCHCTQTDFGFLRVTYTQSNRRCRCYNRNHFSDLKKQRGVCLIRLWLELL